MRVIERDIAGAVIVSADNQILMGQKVPHSGRVYAQGYWVIPGGGLEPGETQLEALHREIIEEVNLDISPYLITALPEISGRSARKTLPTGQPVRVQMKFLNFRVDIPLPAAEIPISPSEELPTLRWFELDKLGSYKLTPPSIELFTKLGYLKPNLSQSPEIPK